jgi:hypothetical protein
MAVLAGFVWWFGANLAAAAPEWLQAQASSTNPAQGAPVASSQAVDPAAIAALRRMGDHLMSRQSMEILAAFSIEYVLDNNQKVLIGGTSRYRVRRPDRLRIDLTSDVLDRVFQYDGKHFVVTAPGENYFARLEAKPTIRETLIWLAQSFGVEIPLADLFEWGTPEAPVDTIREAFRVGMARIGGVPCDHWAFREEGVDWEVWISHGHTPLPLKLSIVTTTDSERPRYEAVLSWTEAADFPDELFVQSPVPNARRIELLPVRPGAR